MGNKHGIIIEENYRNFVPHVNAQRAIDRLLSVTPQKYLYELNSVVLTNTHSLNHNKRRQKTHFRRREIAVRESRGMYHQKWKGKPAWIEILVDNTIKGWPAWVLRVPFCRDVAFAEVLFHELGHHIHYTQAPEYKEREDVAEKWALRLSSYFVKRKYWYIAFPAKIVNMLVKPVRYLIKIKKRI